VARVPEIRYTREMLSPRRVRVFTGGDEDYVYPGSIFAKQRKSVEQRQWTGYGTPARAAHRPWLYVFLWIGRRVSWLGT
jgi:hypothetical protein